MDCIWLGRLIALNGQQPNGIGMQVTKALYMFFPMIVALLLQRAGKERPSGTGLLKFKISRAWLIAVAIPFAVLLLSVLICALIAGCTVNAVAAFGEEYGWRNYMVDALRGGQFWKAALFIGLVWGIWHAPLILLGHNYPQHPVAGVGMMCICCILLGVLELWFVLKTGSVIPAAMMHGTFNAIAGASMFLVNGGSDLTVGMAGLSGFAAMTIIIAVIWLYDRKHD